MKLNFQKYKNKNDKKQKNKYSNEIIKEIHSKHLIKLNKNDN